MILETGGADFCWELRHCRGLLAGGENGFGSATVSNFEWRAEEVVCGSDLFVRSRKLVGAHFG